jgi:hypothetical protein
MVDVNIIDPDKIVWPEYVSPDPLPVGKPVPVPEYNTPSGETEVVSESPDGL